ncbi:hypothetical protein AW168_15845 [Nocardia brasiliensis]|uniref:Uncharacterized protein n=1 Tax=Nocardia brasiliensis (strain ATCC 700358 / HUJEG-1) TaxID=1133849 RepID=K0F1V6_NOCB7|nr:hypothetical protein O3I_018360 [Nocardia brasiliensis ATCC 700358]OCF89125.1 hypothetical protein AW168_15845 [Nocardia brasiliensis]
MRPFWSWWFCGEGAVDEDSGDGAGSAPDERAQRCHLIRRYRRWFVESGKQPVRYAVRFDTSATCGGWFMPVSLMPCSRSCGHDTRDDSSYVNGMELAVDGGTSAI